MPNFETRSFCITTEKYGNVLFELLNDGNLLCIMASINININQMAYFCYDVCIQGQFYHYSFTVPEVNDFIFTNRFCPDVFLHRDGNPLFGTDPFPKNGQKKQTLNRIAISLLTTLNRQITTAKNRSMV